MRDVTNVRCGREENSSTSQYTVRFCDECERVEYVLDDLICMGGVDGFGGNGDTIIQISPHEAQIVDCRLVRREPRGIQVDSNRPFVATSHGVQPSAIATAQVEYQNISDEVARKPSIETISPGR